MYINKKVKITHQNPPPFHKAKHIPPKKTPSLLSTLLNPLHTPPTPFILQIKTNPPTPPSAVEIQSKHIYASQNSVA